MHINKRTRLQLLVFAVIAVLAVGTMALSYLHAPSRLFGVGTYNVTLQLPAAAGLYDNSSVTYRGTAVGRVEHVGLSSTGVSAVLALRSDMKIPADLDAQVHSQSALGEQFVALLPRSANGPDLKDGDVISGDRTSVPPDINALLSATNSGLQAIPHDNLKTAIDEAYTAVGGLGPELSRIVKGTAALASDARANLNDLTTLIDQAKPILDTQSDSADAIQTWAGNVAQVTGELKTEDTAVRGILEKGPAAAEQSRQLLDRLRPTLPIVLTNLVSIAEVAIVYQPNIEQLLVLLPAGMEILQGAGMANRDNKAAYRGAFLSFNLNINLPPPCTTGFLPPQQERSTSEVDYPERPKGDLYCRVPQDSALNVRGVRNIPCETRPDKRAPTVAMCESDESYVPLNDGYNWKGDPNATLSGQSVPQPRLGSDRPQSATSSVAAPPDQPPPIAFAQYDSKTGTYVGPDGELYTQSNLARDADQHRSWQDLLLPPTGN